MAESTPKRVGKFTVVENSESPPSQDIFSEAATEVKAGPPSSTDSVEAFTLRTSQSRRRKAAPKAQAVSQPTPAQVVQEVAGAPGNYQLWAQIFIGSANTVAVTWLGPECAMEKREAEMLEPPIARLFSHLSVEQSKQVAVFIDPMVILIALGMWGNRVVRIQRAKRGVNGITEAEFARASGMANVETMGPTQAPPVYQQPVEPDLPARTRPDINPNGVPVAITDQLGEV